MYTPAIIIIRYYLHFSAIVYVEVPIHNNNKKKTVQIMYNKGKNAATNKVLVE